MGAFSYQNRSVRMFGMSKPKAGERGKAGKPAAAPAKKAALVNVSVKLSAAQRNKLERLGGSAWLREQIDTATTLED
jgi:hypothetical protein